MSEVALPEPSKEIVAIQRLRKDIPEEHRSSDDARIMWLWNQRLIVVQNIYLNTDNVRDKLCANLVLNAAWSANLGSIELVLRRLEGGAVQDTVILEDETLPI